MANLGWGQLSALSCAITWALAIVLFRRSGENLPAFELNLFKNTLGLLLLIPTLALTIGRVDDALARRIQAHSCIPGFGVE